MDALRTGIDKGVALRARTFSSALAKSYKI